MDAPKSETCVCGSTHWHSSVTDRVLWCRRCGAVREVFGEWSIPLDRAGDISRSPAFGDERPTSPAVPGKK